MKKLLPWIKRYYIYSHPFLFSLYGVLFLFANNQTEYRLSVIWPSVAISLGFTLVVFFITKLLFKRLDISAPLSSLIVIICLSYGQFLAFGKNAQLKLASYVFGSDQIVAGVVVLVLVVAVVFIFKFKTRLKVVNKFITILAIILIAFPLYKSVSYEIKSGRMLRKEPSKVFIHTKNRNELGDISHLPDIYYIILDRYDGQRALQEQLHFDNSKFLNFLKDKGFYVPKNSTTNYPKTFLSLASSLNMKYMDFLTKQTEGGASSDESIVTPFLEDNDVMHLLKDNGYSYVHMGSWWEPTKKNRNADVNFYPGSNQFLNADEFTVGFFNLTLASRLMNFSHKDLVDVSQDPNNNTHRQAALFEYDTFKKIPDLPGPKFVFVHILLPHDPFVFDKDCNPISEEVVKKNTHQVNYVNQVQCANKKTEQLIEEIFTKSKTKPVIILQADEGTFPMNSPLPPHQGWGTATDQALREKFPILNAYYFPDGDTKNLYDNITPVNSFRIVLNKYLGTDFPLLPDKNYVFEDDRNYYKFIDVTEKVKN